MIPMPARLIVCSAGRADLRTGTLAALAALPDRPRRRVVVVVPHDQKAAYEAAWPTLGVVAQPKGAPRGLPAAQQWAHTYLGGQKHIHFDDDLRFARRIPGDGTKLRQATPDDLDALISWLEMALERYAHAGVSPRQGNNRQPNECVTGGSMRSVLAVRRDVLQKHDIRWDRCVSKCDYDVVLTLLRLGFRNVITYNWTHDQVGGPKLAGGNTGWRNEDMHQQSADELHALHPDFVKVVTKQKPDWPFPRADVVVQWKAAAEEGALLFGDCHP